MSTEDMASRPSFMSSDRLLEGPWQAFERDVARLYVQNNFLNVQIVGGSGDGGADVLATHRATGGLWVTQCKFTQGNSPPLTAVDEVIEAGRIYGAAKLIVAVSRPASSGMLHRIQRERSIGLDIELAEPKRLLEWARLSPEYAPGTRSLRDYQSEAVRLLCDALRATGRGQVVLATGLGKTVVMAETVATLLRDGAVPHGRILVLAHTRPLVDQLIQAFWVQLPKWIATHRLAEGEEPRFWDGITFATIQSVVGRVDRLPDYGLILVDEAHHIGAVSFQNVLDRLKPPMVAGVTATPWRGDGFDIDTILGPALLKVGIDEGLRRGFLAEVDYRLMADNLDWEFIQSVSENQYSLAQLNKRLIIPTRDEEAARITVETFRKERRRGGIVYCPSGVHANEFAAMMRQYGIRAEAILFDLAPRDRAVLLSRFAAGSLDFVTTVDLFNEGVDVPDVDMLVFMRATHSRRIFVQQLGRGLRISPGKDQVVVLDFVTDLRRVAEVVELDAAVRGGGVERLGLGGQLVAFNDRSAGSFLREWMLDQASLLLRESDSLLQLPNLNFPDAPDSIQ
jgi:superfamily II DNA or RNA helicase